MLYPRQPHMHVCLFDASALSFHKSTYTNTHSRKLECVRAPMFQASVHLWGLEGGKGGWRESERQGGVWGSERERGSHPLTHFSLIHSLHLPSFPPFLELSKESLSPASQLRSSSVQLCHCVCVFVCVCVCNIYKYISISDSISVETCFGRRWKLRSRSCFKFVSRGQKGACDLYKV